MQTKSSITPVLNEMRFSLFIADAFTQTPFKGNPAAVCLMNELIPDMRMQLIATELNLPVTAFILPASNPEADFLIRYFTSTTEIAACGHATLAAAAVSFKMNSTVSLRFQTIERLLINAQLRDGLVTMSYPVYELKTFSPGTDLLKAMRIKEYVHAGICEELKTLFIELEDASMLREISPQFEELVATTASIIEVVITSGSDLPGYDYLLRSFCPWIGIDEDPVTGSVHSVLAGYWQHKTGRSRLKAYQASDRGGEVYVTNLENKVLISGKVVILIKGEFVIPEDGF